MVRQRKRNKARALSTYWRAHTYGPYRSAVKSVCTQIPGIQRILKTEETSHGIVGWSEDGHWKITLQLDDESLPSPSREIGHINFSEGVVHAYVGFKGVVHVSYYR